MKNFYWLMVRRVNLLLPAIVLSMFFSPLLLDPSYGQATDEQIALTFDDGPKAEVLVKLWPLLLNYRVPASFFVQGWCAHDHPDLLRQSSSLGFTLENHSYGHGNFVKLFKAKGETGVVRDLLRAERVIIKSTGRKPKYFRPPLWTTNPEIDRIIIGHGYKIMEIGHPDINTEDYADVWKRQDLAGLITQVERKLTTSKRHSNKVHVLAFHELNLTVSALNILIPQWLQQNYRFVKLENVY